MNRHGLRKTLATTFIAAMFPLGCEGPLHNPPQAAQPDTEAGEDNDKDPSVPLADASAASSPSDFDGDGVENDVDNCPKSYNPYDAEGIQPPTCGLAVRGDRTPYLFLKSRIYRPEQGVPQKFTCEGKMERVLLHIERKPNTSIPLTDKQRKQLEGLGVQIGEYLPHNTFLARIPCNKGRVTALLAKPFVRGIGNLFAQDKMDPEVLANKAFRKGIQKDKSINIFVAFYEDVPALRIAELLKAAGHPVVLEEDELRHVNVPDFNAAYALAQHEDVAWIGEISQPVNLAGPHVGDAEARDLTRVFAAQQAVGSPGAGLILGMSEGSHPAAHPDYDPIHTLANGAGNNGEELHAKMVAATMVGSGSLDTDGLEPDGAGLVPDADGLVSYAHLPSSTRKTRYLKHPRKTRNDYDAVLHNMSFGSAECDAPNYDYESRYVDKATWKHRQVIFDAAGNDDNRKGDCDPAVWGTVFEPAGKNTITVGRADLGSDDCTDFAPCDQAHIIVAAGSTQGPTKEGRIKPDLIAPVHPHTLDYESNSDFDYGSGSGTSGAAPFAAGVGAMVMQALSANGFAASATDVEPHTVKAILLNTARDVGTSGPDYAAGFGFVQADAAVRHAQDLTHLIWEDAHDGSATDPSTTFTVGDGVYSKEILLAWTDKQAKVLSALPLKNDLDLIVTAPSGAIYQPWQLQIPTGDVGDATFINAAAAPATKCFDLGGSVDPNCRDTRNTVEQITLGDGTTPLEVGTWTITVEGTSTPNTPVLFTVVTEPNCPVVIREDTTLAGDITCDEAPLAHSAVVIEADDVVFDCDDGVDRHMIEAGTNLNTKTHVGIEILGDNVTVKNCDVSKFDVGILVRGAAARVENNHIDRPATDDGVGIVVTPRARRLGPSLFDDRRAQILDNDINNFGDKGLYAASGIHVVSGTQPLIAENGIGNSQVGIRVEPLEGETPVAAAVVGPDNEMEGIDVSAVHIGGAVTNNGSPHTRVFGNKFTTYPVGVVISNNGADRPDGVQVGSNGTILDQFNNYTGTGVESGVVISSADNTEVSDVFINMAVGIFEADAMCSALDDNVMIDVNTGIVTSDRFEPVFPLDPCTDSDDCGEDEVCTAGECVECSNDDECTDGDICIDGACASPCTASVSSNVMGQVWTPISAYGSGPITVAGNQLNAWNGIVVDGIGTAEPQSRVDNNQVSLLAPGECVSVSDTDNLQAAGNDCVDGGMRFTDGSDLVVSGNMIDTPTVGLSLGAVTNSVIGGPGGTSAFTIAADMIGVAAGGLDNVEITGLDISGTATAGIHLTGSTGTRIAETTITGTATAIGVELGTDVLPADTVDDTALDSNKINTCATGVMVHDDVSTLAFENNEIAGHNVGFDATMASANLILESFTGNVFDNNTMHAVMAHDTEVCGNEWLESPLLDLDDADGDVGTIDPATNPDNFAECGDHYPMMDANYGGALSGAPPVTYATKVARLVDTAPVASSANLACSAAVGICMP